MNHHPDDQISSFKPVLRFGTLLISIVSIFALIQLWQIAGELGYQINNKFMVGLILLVAGQLLLTLPA